MARAAVVLIGTHKGGFLLRSTSARSKWRLEGPFFPGDQVNHLALDTRDDTPRLYAAVTSPWWGTGVRMSDDLGATWSEPEAGIHFAEDSGNTVARVWQITPGNANEPGTLYAGVDPATLFRTTDRGAHWTEVTSLTKHKTRSQWNAGAGGMMVHSIVPHPEKPGRMHVGISAAGTFETVNDGKTWNPRNRGVLADFHPDLYPEVGQCVHHMEAHPDRPQVLFQQNHCGVYRSDNGGKDWTDINDGLPSRFGFPLLVHPRYPETIYVVPEQGPEFRAPIGGKFAVYRSDDAGERWKRLSRGLPQRAYTHPYRQAMTADPFDPAGIYLGTSTGHLFASFDDGDSWATISDMLPPIYSLEAAVI